MQGLWYTLHDTKLDELPNRTKPNQTDPNRIMQSFVQAMRLTNIAAAVLLFGNFLPVTRSSYCSFGGRRTLSSELPFFEADDDVAMSVFDLFEEDTEEWEDTSDIVHFPFLSRRRTTTEQMMTLTLSEQCIEALSQEDEDEELTASEEEEMDAIDERIQSKGCNMVSATPNVTDSLDIFGDYSNCPDEVASLRASCEEADDDDSGESQSVYVDLPAHQMICTAYVPVLRQLTFHLNAQNVSSCLTKSCHNSSDSDDPSPDWTIADMEFMQEQKLLTCGCGYKKVTCTMLSLEGLDLLEQPLSGGSIATTTQEEEVDSELEQQSSSGGPIAAETTQEEVDAGAATMTLGCSSTSFVGLVIAVAMALF